MPQHIPPDSGAPYIIICSTRINVAATTDETAKIQAASNGAAQFASFMQSHYKHFVPSDALPISTLQHDLMDYLTGDQELTFVEVEDKIKGIVREMYKLEKKYTG